MRSLQVGAVGHPLFLPVRTPALLVLIALSGCAQATAPSPDTVLVVVERSSYVPDPVTGQIVLKVTLINAGTTTAHSSTCYSTGASGIDWAFQKRVGSDWQTKSIPNDGCAPPTFADFTLEPGAQKDVTATGELPAGDYRLGVYFHDETKVWLSRWSSAFAVGPQTAVRR
jgi:hypothetical protein